MYCALRQGKPVCHEVSRTWWQQIFNCTSLVVFPTILTFAVSLRGCGCQHIEYWVFQVTWCDFCSGTAEFYIILLLLFMKLTAWTFELMQIVNTSHLGDLWIPVTFFALIYKLVMEKKFWSFSACILITVSLIWTSFMHGFFSLVSLVFHILTACSS